MCNLNDLNINSIDVIITYLLYSLIDTMPKFHIYCAFTAIVVFCWMNEVSPRSRSGVAKFWVNPLSRDAQTYEGIFKFRKSYPFKITIRK